MTEGADYPGCPEPEPEPEPEEPEEPDESEDPKEPDEAPSANGDDSDDEEPTEPEPKPEEAKESDQPDESENESRELELLGTIASTVFIPLLSAMEIVLSGTVGALIAINFSQALEGISPNGFIFLAFLFALIVVPIRLLEEQIEAPERGEDDE